MRKPKYPGTREAEQERTAATRRAKSDEPDFIGNAPNYDKFEGWSPEEVLAFLNID